MITRGCIINRNDTKKWNRRLRAGSQGFLSSLIRLRSALFMTFSIQGFAWLPFHQQSTERHLYKLHQGMFEELVAERDNP